LKKEVCNLYKSSESVVFRKTTEQWGGLSNMCAGFDLVVNNMRIQSSEILYQACRFPNHPSLQMEILSEANPMTAKNIARKNTHFTRQGWDSNRISIMKWSVFSKLCQNWDSFHLLLESTGDKFIVEHSEKDIFWGARKEDDYFYGVNALGRILMFTRNAARVNGKKAFSIVQPLKIPQFYLLGSKITPVNSTDKPPPPTAQLF